MTARNTTLTPRAENTRNSRTIDFPKQFNLSEIKQHFTDSMNEVKEQFNVADNLNKDGNIIACKMVWRSQIVLSESLLDFYIHEMSKYCIVRMFLGSWNKSEQYNNFLIPMSKIEDITQSEETADWLFEYLNHRFSHEVFLSPDKMKDQLNLIGIEFGKVMVKAFPKESEEESIKTGKKTILNLFKRRNEIAHQNDRCHFDATQADITKDYVEDFIMKIELIVDSIHNIAEEKECPTDI
jgi:hypothetical protein|nr:MAG TPA: hypothetical protein [Bacteriophage sp.]